LQTKIIEYVEQGRFICGLVLQDQGKRLRIINQNGREMNLPLARVVHQGTTDFSHESREETMRFLKETADQRQSLQQEIDLTEIWGLAVEENEDSFSATFLTELAFDEDAGDDQVAAFVRAVFSDRILFRYKDNNIIVHSAEKVDQLREQQEKEKAKEDLLAAGAQGLAALMNGDMPSEWPEKDYCLGIIRDYYLFGNDASESGLARDLLKRAELNRPHDPYHILVKAGMWDKDENIHLYRQQVDVAFDDEVLEDAQQQEPDLDSLLASGRKDFRDLPLMTIDGEFTRDFDDALHVEKIDDNYLVGIHIADVSEFVQPASPLFNTASQRGTSIYFADHLIPMLPSELSEGLCSLIEGKVRPALSFLVTMSVGGEILNYKIVRSVVQVKRRITYTQAESMLDQDSELKILYALSMKFQQHRVENGAVIIPIPDVDISFPDEGGIKVALNPADSRARTLVAELMVMANFLAAQYIADRQLPGLFRSQEPPRKRLAVGIPRDLFTNFRQRRFLSRGELLTEPKSHSGVGVAQYTTITSPIRRFLDLLMQQQLCHVLQGKGALFSQAECRDYAGSIQHAQGRANQVRYLRHRYWLLKYLEQEIGVGNKMKALVLEVQPRRVQVVLPDILLEGDLPINQAMHVEPGDTVMVKLAKVSALDNTFRLEW
jgi:exoribonuclease-2